MPSHDHSKYNVLRSACQLLVIGVMVSFAGWIFETVGRFILYGQTTDRGFLTLPLCPIYGISIISIYVLVGTPAQLRGVIGERIRKTSAWQRVVQQKKTRKLLFYFLFVTILSTSAELVTGLVAKSLGITLWDYSDRAFNLFGVICLSFSLAWGVLITTFMLFLWNPLYSLAYKINNRTLFPLSLTLSVPITVDFLVSLLYLLITGEAI